MRAFLLAAGEGRRLRPLTDTIPKCLVPIGGTPLLGIWLDLLEKHGVTDVLVNMHYLADQVTSYLKGRRGALRVRRAHEPRLLGSAGTVLANRDFVEQERDFLIVYADNLTNVDLSRMVAFHRRLGEPLTLGVVPTDRPHEKGIVVVRTDGRVIEFAEKPSQPRSNLANAGIYVATSALFDYFPGARADGTTLDFGYDILPRVVPRAAAYRIDEFLEDIGTRTSYESAQARWVHASR